MNSRMERHVSRVLVVDDDEGIRHFTSRVLASGGYEVVVARDGPDAIRLVEAQTPFDLFVIDMMIPGMRGDELARWLYQHDPNTKVLYFTGYTERLFAACPALRENEAFLQKPVMGSEFLEAVSQLLFGHVRGPAVVGLDTFRPGQI